MAEYVRLPVFERPSASALTEEAALNPGTGPQGLMQVGDLAQQSGKTVRAIHLYEELHLLTPVSRSKGGYRLYDASALVRIRWIAKLQELGMSLPDIQSLARDWQDEQFATKATLRMKEVYAAKLAATREQLERLSSLERELEASLAYLEACGDVCEPERLTQTCQSCDLHRESPCGSAAHKRAVPELIAGFRAGAPSAAGPLPQPKAKVR
ncbi:MAG: MerR family transcriptional regulator [Polyangiaceae bacterium]